MAIKQKFIRGFTIIELLIVIAVIGILAGLTAVIYNGVQTSAYDTSVLSDLDVMDGLQTNYGIHHNTAGKDYYSGNGPDSELDFAPSSGNVIDVVTDGQDYCIRGYNPRGTRTTIDDAFTKESTTGACSRIDASALAGAYSGTASQTMVTTLAGSDVSGFADGTGAGAQFSWPDEIGIDTSGNIYIADSDNYSVRKVTPAGVVTTLAGSGVSGYADGTGAGAQFAYLDDVEVDATGNVFVADSFNNRIRKVTPAGVVTTIAGSTYGFTDGTGAGARFARPYGVAVDTSGNVYVADSGNHRIRKVTPAGVVTTLAGSGVSGYADGTGAGAQFNSPDDVEVDSSGNVYVADTYNYRIRKVTPAGVVTTLAGSGVRGFADGIGVGAQFSYIYGMTLDTSGNVYVADSGNHRIRKVTPAGVVTTLAGSGIRGFVDGTGASAQFNWPGGVAMDASDSVMYVSDTRNYRIRKIELN